MANSNTDDNYCYFCDHLDATGMPIYHLTHCQTFEDLPEWEAEAAGIDRRSTRARRWNLGFLLARIVALAVEPLLFYALTTGRDGNTNMCVYMDSGFATVVTVAATCLDAVHMVYIWRGPLKRQPTPWFDVFFLLPVLQAVFWLRAPKLIREQNVDILINTMISIFLLQFLSKAYLCFCMIRRRQKVTAGHVFFFFDKLTGHIFGAIGLSLIAYLIASHVAGACWYLLALQRQCGNSKAVVRTVEGRLDFGIYQLALPIISSNSLAVKILHPISWGLKTVGTLGTGLDPSNDPTELLFSICIVISSTIGIVSVLIVLINTMLFKLLIVIITQFSTMLFISLIDIIIELHRFLTPWRRMRRPLAREE